MASIASDAVFTRTAKGVLQAQGSGPLTREQQLVLGLIDGKTPLSEIQRRSALTFQTFQETVQALEAGGAICRVSGSGATSRSSESPSLDFTPSNPAGHAEFDLADRVRKLNERVRVAQATRSTQAEDDHVSSKGDDDWPALQLNLGGAPSPAFGAPATTHSDTYTSPARDNEHTTSALERTIAAMARLRAQEPAAAPAAQGGDSATSQTQHTSPRPEPRLEPFDPVPPPQLPAEPAADEPRLPTTGANEPTIDDTEPSKDRLHVDRAAHDVIAEGAAARRREEAARLNRDALALRARRAEEDAKRRVTARKARRRRTLLISTGVAAIVFVAGTVAWLQFVPLNEHVPAVQRALTQRLAQPVTVGAVRYVLLPRPQLIVEDVAIGTAGSGVRIGRLSSPIGPLGAWGGVRELESVRAQKVVIDPAALAAIPAWTGGRTAGAVHTRTLQLSEVTLQDVPLEPFGGEVAFEPNGTIRTARFANEKATLELHPTPDGMRIKLDALDWRIPLGPPVEFGRLVVRGLVDSSRLAAAEFTGHVGGGALEGALTARWNGPVTVQGEFKTDGVRLQELYRGNSDYGVRGTANIAGRFMLRGNTWKTLTEDPQVTASFAAARGELTNLDLMRALQNPAREMRGGRTTYETLTGIVQTSREAITFRQLQLTSGPLNAAGTVNVRPGGQLDGKVVAEIAGRGGRTALAVGGTASDPALSR